MRLVLGRDRLDRKASRQGRRPHDFPSVGPSQFGQRSRQNDLIIRPNSSMAFSLRSFQGWPWFNRAQFR